MQEAASGGLDRISFCLFALRELWSGEIMLAGCTGEWLAWKWEHTKFVLFGVLHVVTMLNRSYLQESLPALHTLSAKWDA